MPSFGERLKNSWNAFLGRDPTDQFTFEDLGVGTGYRPDRIRLTRGNERSIITAVYNRIALDVAAVDIEHVRKDATGNFKEPIDSRLNHCLTLEANIDQSSSAFIQDVCMSMFDEGVVGILPVDTITKGTTADPAKTDAYDILSMRTCKILEWYPRHVRVRAYNDQTGKYQDKIFSKGQVAIIENPFYAVMNEPNSTLQRLIRTINNIDKVNADSASGKLDLIIQLPYVTRSPRKKNEAELRRKEIEDQLTNTKYGIAYTDGTEKITQLNRAVENNLWAQYTDLVTQLFSQLGLTQEIVNGSADETVMINYYSRTVDPILNAIAQEMERKFLSPTARAQGQAIQYFRDPFGLVPADKLADIADKLTRNEILSSNEVRSEMGFRPVQDPMADQLRNKNVSASPDMAYASTDPDAIPSNEQMAMQQEQSIEDNQFSRAKGLVGKVISKEEARRN